MCFPEQNVLFFVKKNSITDRIPIYPIFMFIRDHLDLKNIGRVNLESHTLNLSTKREATAEPLEQPLHALAVCQSR